MFHFEGLIDDKDVVKFHYGMATLKVYNLEIRPVVNVKRGRQGKLVEQVQGGTIRERVVLQLRQRYGDGSQFSRADIDDIVRNEGGAPGSHLPGLLVKAKILKRKGRSLYELGSRGTDVVPYRGNH